MSIADRVDALTEYVTVAQAWAKDFGDVFDDVWPIEPQEIPGLFSKLSSMPEPGQLDGAIEQVTRALGHLSDDSHDVDPESGSPATIFPNPAMEYPAQLGDAIDKWQGEAARAYSANYAHPFHNPVRPNNFGSLVVLRGALLAEQAIWREAHTSTENLISATADAVWTAIEDDGSDWGFALTLVAAVAGVGAAVFTGGASLSLTVVSAASSVAASEATTETAAGQLPGLVLLGMAEGIGKIEQEIEVQERKVQKALTDYAAARDGARDSFVFEVSPGISVGPGGLIPG